LAHEVGEQIKVVTGLGENEGSGALFVVPISPHKAVGETPKIHWLKVSDGNGLTQSTGVQNRLDLPEVGRVAEHVANREDPLRLFGALYEAPAVLFAQRHRFLQQNVIASLQECQGGFNVVIVGSGYDSDVGQAFLLDEFSPVFKEVSLLEMVSLAGKVSAQDARVGDPYDLEPIGSRE